MRKRRLLTAVLCCTLAAAVPVGASETIPSEVTKTESTQTSLEASSDGGSETPATTAQTSPPQTSPPQTSPPQTDPPQTDPPQTSPPQTNPPETNPPQTDPPQTSAPATDSPETNAPETNAPETSAPATEAPATESPETTPGETVPETGSQTETAGGQTESEIAAGTESQTETAQASESGTESESSTESESGTESESETESETDPEEESEMESETSEYGSNEELIAHQNIVTPPDISLEYRFTQVEKDYAVVSNPEGCSVYEEKSQDSREVGKLEYYGICYILADEESDWVYIESGNVRGFVEAENLASGEVADRIVKVKGEEELPAARLTVARTENEAFAYTHTTVQDVMADKVYAIAARDLQIYEQKKASSRVIGTLEEGGLCYILADSGSDWVYVESGDSRGFVQAASLQTGSAASAVVSEAGENNLAQAVTQVEPENNKACYYTVTSVKEASQAAKTREALVNYALQFVGNPYVWGGTSLTNGADCSGFVQTLYATFGYSLPRVADAQSVTGMQIPISSAEPGDLIFYAKNGYVYHVSMYIGNGQVIHAAGRSQGIIVSGISGNAVWATRLIQD